MDPNRVVTANGYNRLAACGVGFDSHRPSINAVDAVTLTGFPPLKLPINLPILDAGISLVTDKSYVVLRYHPRLFEEFARIG